MKIPTFSGAKIAEKDGSCHPEFQQYQDQLNQQMQLTISDDGFVVPSNTTANINHIADNNNPNGRPNGTMWYDSTTNQFKRKRNGVVEVF